MFHYNTGIRAKNVTFFIKVRFNIRDQTIMIGEMPFKCLFFFDSIAERPT